MYVADNIKNYYLSNYKKQQEGYRISYTLNYKNQPFHHSFSLHKDSITFGAVSNKDAKEAESANFSYRISMDPPDRENKIAIFKFYLNGITSGKVDYTSLANALEKREKEFKGAYSNSQIKNQICNSNDKTTISQDDILERIKTSKPTIDSTALRYFNEDVTKFMPYKLKRMN